nr:MAG TPA: hypothetical protein [Caudoviricetes sp.]
MPYAIYSSIIPLYLSIYTIYSKEVVVMPNSKQTSAKVASKASKILSDGRYSKTSKSVAGSALSQTKKK